MIAFSEPKTTYEANLTIHAVTPFTVSNGQNSRPLLNSQKDARISRGKDTVPIMARKGPEGENVFEPVVPSSTIRGRLRREAAWNVWRALEARKNGNGNGVQSQITPPDYYRLVLGGLGFDGDTTDLAVGAKVRRACPLMGLFGAGNPRMASCLSIVSPAATQDGIDAIVEAENRQRRDDFKRDAELFNMLPPDDAERIQHDQEITERVGKINQKINDKKSERKSAEKAKKAKIDKEIEELRRQGDEWNNQKYDSVIGSIDRPLDNFYVVRSGTTFSGRMQLCGALPAELGLLMDALDSFAENPRLGGFQAHGYGRVAVEGTICRRRGKDEDGPTGELIEVASFGLGGDDKVAPHISAGFRVVPAEGVDELPKAMETWERIKAEIDTGSYDGVPLVWTANGLDAFKNAAA